MVEVLVLWKNELKENMLFLKAFLEKSEREIIIQSAQFQSSDQILFFLFCLDNLISGAFSGAFNGVGGGGAQCAVHITGINTTTKNVINMDTGSVPGL